MSRTRLIGLLAALLSVAPAAHGALLFERSLVVDRSVNIFTTDEFSLEFVFANTFFTPTNPVTLFAGLTITPADMGRVIVADSTTDPAFAAAVERMTDTLDQNIRLAFTEVASGRAEQRGWSENGFFIGEGSEEAPGLAGEQIDAVQLRIDDFRLVPDASAGALPPVQLLLTLSVMGVPEPSSLGLACGCLLGLSVAAYTVARRRRAMELALRRGLCPVAAPISRGEPRG